MAIEKLSYDEKQIVFSCLCAIARGPFIKDDWEFHTRLGLHRSTLYELIEMWPQIDDSVDDSDQTLALNNAMNEICHGIRFSDADWVTWFSVSRDTVKSVYKKWCRLRGKDSSGIM